MCIEVHWIAGWKRKYVYFGDRIEIGQCKIESNNSITRDQGWTIVEKLRDNKDSFDDSKSAEQPSRGELASTNNT